MVDDNTLEIAKIYGMLHPQSSLTKDIRGVFIIGPQNKIEATFFYPMNIGRNMDELKRTLIALQTAGTGKERYLTPANWHPGETI